MLRHLRNLLRLTRIALTLARHDALFPLEAFGIARPLIRGVRALVRITGLRKRTARDRRPGERLADALTALGPSFIKLGQSLATRADLLGEEITADLSLLQDKLPPFPGETARTIIETELGQPVEDLFPEFTDDPVAAASIAQVHFARTPDGAEVAVKVLRPGIEDAFARDMDLMTWAAEWIEWARPDLRRLKPREAVATLARVVAVEMDLRMEAAAASELRQNFAGDSTFQIPEVDWQRTAQRVLTLERITGIPIDERDRLVAAGIDPDEVLRKAACSFFNQVFRDGFFHADLHPGNLFVGEDGNLRAVDFGIMGRLDRNTRRYLAEMLHGFLERDYALVADVHFRAGYIPPDQPRDLFMQACRAIGEPILGLPQNEISIARLLAQLFSVTETFQMETQPQLLLLQKTMMVAEGVGRHLNPNVNMWELARPLIQSWAEENMGVEARLRDGVAMAMANAARLPRMLDRIEAAADALARGADGEDPRQTLERTVNQNRMRAVLWAIAAILGGILIAMLD